MKIAYAYVNIEKKFFKFEYYHKDSEGVYECEKEFDTFENLTEFCCWFSDINSVPVQFYFN